MDTESAQCEECGQTAQGVKMNPTPQQIRQRAYRLTQKAIASGKIARATSCGRCGQVKPLVARHVDYACPERVEWLCGSCHKLAHIAAGDVVHWRTGKVVTTSK